MRGPLHVFRTAARYPADRLGWYALDRASRVSARLAPDRALNRLLARPAGVEVDGAFLRAWGGHPAARLLAPAWRPKEHGDPRRGTFRLVGLERRFPRTPPFGSPGIHPLWDEQLAWLESTWALAASCSGPRVRSWLADWLPRVQAATRPGTVALRPFPTATRLLHAARTLALLHAAGHGGDPAAAALRDLLWRDGAWLRWRVEHHNAANHLLREQIALLVWDRVFGRRRAGRARALARTVARQFGPCGGHVEQAAAYQHQAVRDLLELAVAIPEQRASLAPTIGQAMGLLHWLRVEDGVLAFGDGDATSEVAPLCSAAEALQLEPQIPGALHSPVFGLAGRRVGRSRVLLRAGVVPSRTCAHVHADQGAMAWVLGGHRVIDGRGTATYSGPLRDATRSASWRSTVTVPGRTTAVFAGPFRLAAWGGGQVVAGDTELEATTTDTSGVPLHRRSVRVEEQGIVVVDQAHGRGTDGATAHFHFPEATVLQIRPRAATLATPAGAVDLVANAPVVVSDTSWFPRIGVEAPAVSVAIALAAADRSATTSVRRRIH